MVGCMTRRARSPFPIVTPKAEQMLRELQALFVDDGATGLDCDDAAQAFEDALADWLKVARPIIGEDRLPPRDQDVEAVDVTTVDLSTSSPDGPEPRLVLQRRRDKRIDKAVDDLLKAMKEASWPSRPVLERLALVGRLFGRFVTSDQNELTGFLFAHLAPHLPALERRVVVELKALRQKAAKPLRVGTMIGLRRQEGAKPTFTPHAEYVLVEKYAKILLELEAIDRDGSTDRGAEIRAVILLEFPEPATDVDKIVQQVRGLRGARARRARRILSLAVRPDGKDFGDGAVQKMIARVRKRRSS